MSEYDDRNVWSDGDLLHLFIRVGVERPYEQIYNTLYHALLARMKPTEAKPLLKWKHPNEMIKLGDILKGKNGIDYPVVDGSWWICQTVEHLISLTTNFYAVVYPVPAQEPPATKEDEWEDMELGKDDILRRRDVFHWSVNGGTNQEVYDCNIGRRVGEFSCPKVTRRVRKQTQPPLDLAGCVPWDGEKPEDAIRRVRDKAKNTEKALEIATKMLKRLADDCCYFSVKCDAEHALAEIEKLTGMGTNCTSPIQTAIEKAYVTIAFLQLEVAIDHLKRIEAQADVNTKLPTTTLTICRLLANQAIAEIDRLAEEA